LHRVTESCEAPSQQRTLPGNEISFLLCPLTPPTCLPQAGKVEIAEHDPVKLIASNILRLMTLNTNQLFDDLRFIKNKFLEFFWAKECGHRRNPRKFC
jgi:hypothetical protein